MEFKYSTPEKTDIKRALGSKCGCFCHSGTNSTSQLIPQVFNGVEDRTTGRLFHPLHSQTDSRRNYTRASALAQVVPKKSTSPKLNDYQTAALTACDKGTGDTNLGPAETTGEIISWPSAVCTQNKCGSNHLHPAGSLLPSRQ